MSSRRTAAVALGGAAAGVVLALVGQRAVAREPRTSVSEEARETLEQIAVLEYRLKQHKRLLTQLQAALEVREEHRVLTLARQTQLELRQETCGSVSRGVGGW